MKLNDTQKARLVRHIVRYFLYAVVIGSVALILSGVFSSTQITLTVNWVKCLIGGALLYAVNFTCDWVFRRRPTDKKDNTNT